MKWQVWLAIVLACIAGLICMGSTADAQEGWAPQVGAAAVGQVEEAVDADPADVALDPNVDDDHPAFANAERMERFNRLTFRERRKLGLTMRDLLATARQLKERGRLGDDLTKSEYAAELAYSSVSQNMDAYAKMGVDWDAIIEFIERLVPIIEWIISLFG